MRTRDELLVELSDSKIQISKDADTIYNLKEERDNLQDDLNLVELLSKNEELQRENKTLKEMSKCKDAKLEVVKAWLITQETFVSEALWQMIDAEPPYELG